MVVQHNLTAMNSNRMLGLTTASQAKSTEKLSSGYKINRAADDAAGLAISEKMRRQVRGLTQASANAQDGISAVQTAEGALTEVHDMLQRMNELATKSSNGTNSQEERDYIQSEVDALINEIDRVSETTKFNEIYLLKGAQGTDSATDTTPVKKTMTLSAAGKKQMEQQLTVKADAYAKGETDAVKASAGATAASMKLDTTALGTDKLFVSPSGDFTTNADAIEVTDANLSTYFTVADDGTISAKAGVTFAKTDTKAKADAGVGGIADGTVMVTGTAKADAVTGDLDKYVEIKDGEIKYKEGMVLYSAAADPTGQYGAQGKDELIDEKDLGTYFEKSGNPILTDDTDDTKVLAEDADLSAYFDEYGNYKGGLYLKDDADNIQEIGAEQIGKYFSAAGEDGDSGAAGPALEFKLHVGAEGGELAQANCITVKIESMSAAGIGIDGLKSTGVAKQEDAQNAIKTIADAIQKVSKQRSDLGAVQNRLEHTINNLDNIVENTQSAESAIRDTDMATEMVKYANNNILAQAGQAMLAQANQANQGVLSLLG